MAAAPLLFYPSSSTPLAAPSLEHQSDLVSRVAAHFFTEEFQAGIDDYIRKHCATFADVTDEQISGAAENKIEHWTGESWLLCPASLISDLLA